jgi:acyl-CoA hydrolase
VIGVGVGEYVRPLTVSAMRFAGETCVTAAVTGIGFENPVPIGSVALVESYVYGAGRTSVRVHLRVESEDPRTGETTPTNTSCFVFVAIDDDGDPIPVPDLTVETDRERRLRDQALDAEADG